MSKPAKSVFYFGIYLILMGIMLMTIPNTLLGIFRLPATHEVWIRVVGLLAVALGYYYMYAGKYELTNFIRWTTHTRPLVIVVFTVFVLLGFGHPILILFGAIDLAGAAWTFIALKNGSS